MGTSSAVRVQLVEALTGLIESTGASVFTGFPMVNKLVELRLMGRQHPGVAGGAGQRRE